MRLELHGEEDDLDEARVDSLDWLWLDWIIDRRCQLREMEEEEEKAVTIGFGGVLVCVQFKNKIMRSLSFKPPHSVSIYRILAAISPTYHQSERRLPYQVGSRSASQEFPIINDKKS
ncbi:hypothetical protein QYF36_002712 [Acer negundo]|nr:hypothetical protein QYF36_002712 [Acer negundo]